MDEIQSINELQRSLRPRAIVDKSTSCYCFSGMMRSVMASSKISGCSCAVLNSSEVMRGTLKGKARLEDKMVRRVALLSVCPGLDKERAREANGRLSAVEIKPNAWQ